MKRRYINSSTLLSAGYDAKKRILELEFTSKEVYRYKSVPASVYEALMKAASAGAYFNEAIRDRFHFIKLNS